MVKFDCGWLPREKDGEKDGETETLVTIRRTWSNTGTRTMLPSCCDAIAIATDKLHRVETHTHTKEKERERETESK